MSAEVWHLETAEEAAPDVGLTPLIDVVFQLLVFFLLTTTFALPALKIALPEIEPGVAATPENGLTIDIEASGAILVQGQSAAGGDWRQLLTAQPEPATVALIRADREASYGKVSEVMQALGKAGIEQINFVHAPSPAD